MDAKEKLLAEKAAIEAKLKEIEETEKQVALVDGAKRVIALISAMKEIVAEIHAYSPDVFSERWEVLQNAKAWPRYATLRKLAGLSETEQSNAVKAGRDMVKDIQTYLEQDR